MAIHVACRCGQEFETAAEHAGRRVSCPVCGKPLVIPRDYEPEPVLERVPEPELVALGAVAPPDSEPLTNISVLSGYAIASLVLGVMSLFCLAFTGLPAIVLGWLGLRSIRGGRGRVRGTALALLGLAFGLFGTLLTGIALYPFLNSVRESLTRQECVDRLKRIGQALHNYHGQYGRFPRAAIVDKKRQPLLSWRVAILPFMGPEGEALYRQFKLDEPWDSPHNLPLAKTTPWFYVCPSQHRDLAGTTNYQVAVGPNTVFTGGKGISLGEIVDGTWNTILVTESKRAVPWTAPQDMASNPSFGVSNLGSEHPDGVNALYADGSVRELNLFPGSLTIAPFTRDDTAPVPSN